MRIYWLNPPLSTRSIYPDLAWMNMRTACKEYHWVDPIIDWTLYKTLDDVVEHIISNNIKVLCVSCYIWNHVLISDVCKKVKSIDPNIIVIRGGPQLERDLKFDWFDYACDGNGHGEEFLVSALPQVNQHGSIVDPQSVPWLISKDFRFTPSKGRYTYPSESVIEYNLPYILQCFSISKEKGIKCSIQYETTRGCPYSCTYCEWGAGGTSAKLSQKSLDVILKDIELLAMIGLSEFEITDANFGILARDIDVVNYMGEMKRKYGYPESIMMYGLAKVQVEKREKLLDALFKNKLLSHYFMSVQSISQTALKNVKRTDISVDENLSLAKKLKETYGAVIKVELILGLPGSTIDDFYQEMDLIQATNGWLWPRAPLTILPQTESASKEYLDSFEIKTAKVTITENEEQDVTYISNNSILGLYRSYQDIAISCYSYSVDEWKEMFFMNKAQKVIGPMIPTDVKASDVMRDIFKKIKVKEWYKKFNDDMQKIVTNTKEEDYMIIDGKTVEEHLEDYIDEIKFMVNEHSYL